jgi:two-component system sensor histidine kinase/response regulator
MNKENNSAYKILIVDDIPKNIQILGNILSRENYQIAYAQLGEEALTILEKQMFDLILLDIMMPGMDGYEVCNKLKNNEKTKDIPVIFLTAKADMESIVKGFESGGADYVTKPFSADELLARVKTHIQLNAQKKELKTLNENLEKIVDERTKQLNEANKRLQVLDRAKTDFLSIISHELRTPLNGILGLMGLLEQTSLDEKQKEYLTFLKNSSDRLMKFSEIALLITSLRAQAYKPDLMPVEIENIINLALYELKENNEKTLPVVNINIDKNTNLALAESDLLKKSIALILDNAVEYAGNDKPIDISVFTASGKIHIAIDDYGKGFSKESLEHLFELFSTDDLMHSEGKGLSLAAVKLIMDIHGGEIVIKNRKDSGARVELILKSFNED